MFRQIFDVNRERRADRTKVEHCDAKHCRVTQQRRQRRHGCHAKVRSRRDEGEDGEREVSHDADDEHRLQREVRRTGLLRARAVHRVELKNVPYKCKEMPASFSLVLVLYKQFSKTFCLRPSAKDLGITFLFLL